MSDINTNVYDNALKMKVLQNLLNDRKPKETLDDKTFRDNVAEEITNRDKYYTELLTHFVKITKVRNCLKEIFKWSFYVMVIVAMITLIIVINSIFHVFIKEANVKQLMEAIPLFITAIVGFVSVIIAIPIAITKYLFSTKEDENITSIILHTQDHDTNGRQWAMEFKKIAGQMVGEKTEKSISGNNEKIV